MTNIAVIGALGIVGKSLSDYFELNGNKVFRNDIKEGCNIVSLKTAIYKSDIIFVCVPTPPDKDGKIDLSAIRSVTHDIGSISRNLGKTPSVVYKSTIVPGTTYEMSCILSGYLDGCRVAYNPEFLRQRYALFDTLSPSRIVVGSKDKEFAKKVINLYANTPAPKFIFDSYEAAELTKYYANSYYATRISFFNQMSLFAKRFKCCHQDIVDAIVADPMVGIHGSNPTGVAYSGSCLPKDLSAIINKGREISVDVRFLEDVERMNKIIKKSEENKKIREWCG